MKTRILRPIGRKIAAFRICLLAIAVEMTMTPVSAQSNQTATSPQTPQLMDRQKEIALALSACPP